MSPTSFSAQCCQKSYFENIVQNSWMETKLALASLPILMSLTETLAKEAAGQCVGGSGRIWLHSRARAKDELGTAVNFGQLVGFSMSGLPVCLSGLPVHFAQCMRHDVTSVTVQHVDQL